MKLVVIPLKNEYKKSGLESLFSQGRFRLLKKFGKNKDFHNLCIPKTAPVQ